MLEVQKLYPQYKAIQDRRQQSVPVSFERRSGVERRSQDRVLLDTNLTRDIFEIKSKVSQLKKPESNNVSKVAFTQNAEKSALNSLKTDQFVKTTKTEPTDNAKAPSKSNNNSAAMAIGILASVLGGIVASTLMGPAGVFVAVGLGAYCGGKLLKQVMSTHMKDK